MDPACSLPGCGLLLDEESETMKSYARLAVAVIATVTLLLPPAAQAARKGKELLQYIPADTPYVFAVTKPLPQHLQDRFEPAIDATLSAYRQVFLHHVGAEVERLRATAGGEAQAAQLQALANEITSLLSVEELRKAGLGRGSLIAVYGDGLLPVMRIASTDADAFDGAVGRIEAAATAKFEVGSIDGKSYRYLDMDGMRFIIATFGKDAVITLVPAAYSDARLAEVLGLKKPPNNLARSKALRQVTKEYGFTDHMIGLVDVTRLANFVLSDPGGRNEEFLRLVERDGLELSEACEAEFMELAAIAPRIVTGYTQVGKDSLDMSMIVEMRADIAAGFATLPALVPGLGKDLGGLMSFGLSLDPLALRTFYEARLDAMEADPFECELLGELQASVPKGREALAKPIPPMVYSFRGFLANLTDMRGADLANHKRPEEVDGSLLFAVENAEALVTMAALMSPEVAALNILPDGKARQLNLPQLAQLAQEAFAALSESALAVAVGAGAQQAAEAMLRAEPAASRPFASFSVDAGRYYDLMGDAVMRAEPDDGEEPPPEELRSAIRDIMRSSGELYERMAVDVHFTERGIEISSRMTLAD
jgi:hypothetical protein